MTVGTMGVPERGAGRSGARLGSGRLGGQSKYFTITTRARRVEVAGNDVRPISFL